MKAQPSADAVLLARMPECIAHIAAYNTGGERAQFDASRSSDQTGSNRASAEAIKGTEPTQPWRELAGFRNLVVHVFLSLDLAVVWSIVEQDLPALGASVQRMAERLARA